MIRLYSIAGEQALTGVKNLIPLTLTLSLRERELFALLCGKQDF